MGGMSSSLLGLQNKEERIDVVPSFPACSKAGENCISTGCCQVSGHKCFSKGNGQAQCNKTCTAGVKGFTCDIIDPHSVPVATPLGQNLYCFSVYTENTGNESLVSHELELLNISASGEWLRDHQSGRHVRRVPSAEAKGFGDLGELGHVLPGLGEDP